MVRHREGLLDELDAYAVGHFFHEEECVRRYQCPAAAVNMREHQAFLEIVARFKSDFDTAGASTQLVLRVKDQLAWWVENHIRAGDTRLLPCVKGQAQ